MATARVPGFVVAASYAEGPPMVFAIGNDAAGTPLAGDDLFPVASITKLATALAVLRLIDLGALELDANLAAYTPEAAAALPGVTIRRLLSHTAGLPLDLSGSDSLYASGTTWRDLAQACLQEPPADRPDSHVQYSNTGYGLLAIVVERVTGQPFAAALQTLVLEPLGITGYLGVEPPRRPAQIAGVRGTHAGTTLEPFNSPFWRALALPWAGLLTNATGAMALVLAFQNTPAPFLQPQTRAEALRNQTGILAGGFVKPLLWSPCPWGLGVDLRGAKNPHWVTDLAGPASFGHSGASGTLAWNDPQAGVAWAILGARTADNGWLLRRGPAITRAIMDSRC